MEKGAFCLCAMGRLSGRFLETGALGGMLRIGRIPAFPYIGTAFSAHTSNLQKRDRLKPDRMSTAKGGIQE